MQFKVAQFPKRAKKWTAASPATVHNDLTWFTSMTNYAVSGTRAVVCSSGMFAFNQTFARQRPKNGAARIIAKATAIATCICALLFR
jgi:hypothetical protein